LITVQGGGCRRADYLIHKGDDWWRLFVKIQRVGVFAVSRRVDCCCGEIDILLGEGPATYQIFFLVF
jgi:hypothetical protein